jgi:hypothetical protein
MKKIFILLGAVSVMTANAQVGVQKKDSIETGATYLNDVYYSLESGNKTEVPNNNWHLAFRIGAMNDGIRINSATATGANDGTVKLHLYPNAGIAGWDDFDTTGWSSWLAYENSDETWEVGAFNRSSTGFPDVSWGVYSTSTHVVTGDSLYLVVYKNAGATKYKKLWIVNKTSGTWNFKYADLDGSNEKETAIASADYSGKNYIYYNLESNEVVNREPASAAWDFVLTRYQAWQAIPVYAAATGILTNIGVKTAKAKGAPAEDLKLEDFIQDTSDIIKTIGYNWKYYETDQQFNVTWHTEDSLAYFVLDKNRKFWKIEFISFGGSSNGRTVFYKTEVETENGGNVSVEGIAKGVSSTAVYPNPASQSINVLLGVETNAEVKISIIGMNGQLIDSRNVNTVAGINQEAFNIAALNSGIYFVKIEGEGFLSTQKFVKQ